MNVSSRAQRFGLLTALLAAASGCAHAPAPTAAVSFGTAMVDVGHRFEVLGRAIAGGRFELAQYELGEIEEQFEDTLPHASPPKEGHPEILPAEIAGFLKANVPDLDAALKSGDAAQAKAAFERTATACNACHQASGHPFIEVPLVAGHAVPDTDPR